MILDNAAHTNTDTHEYTHTHTHTHTPQGIIKELLKRIFFLLGEKKQSL